MEHETLKEIPGYDGYSISPNGDVFSNKRGHLRKLKPFLDGRGKYLLIGLIGNDGRRRKVLVHRLVAICYIPNPNKLPEVNHKDKNTQNPSMKNLEWCTRKDNLRDSYTTMSPVREIRGSVSYSRAPLWLENLRAFMLLLFMQNMFLVPTVILWKSIYVPVIFPSCPKDRKNEKFKTAVFLEKHIIKLLFM